MLLKIHAEGQTEGKFVKKILESYFISLGFSQAYVIINQTGRSFRGGISRYAQFRKNTVKLCGSSSECLITTMIDFYGLPADFPGYNEIDSISKNENKVKHLEEKLKEDLQIKKPNYFIPYIQLHEFEALLFSDIYKIDEVLKGDKGSYINELERIIKKYHEPEKIDTDEGPSRKLIKITDNQYSKINDGIDIAEKITLKVMRDKCPHFDEWLKQIEKFAEEHSLKNLSQ